MTNHLPDHPQPNSPRHSDASSLLSSAAPFCCSATLLLVESGVWGLYGHRIGGHSGPKGNIWVQKQPVHIQGCGALARDPTLLPPVHISYTSFVKLVWSVSFIYSPTLYIKLKLSIELSIQCSAIKPFRSAIVIFDQSFRHFPQVFISRCTLSSKYFLVSSIFLF